MDKSDFVHAPRKLRNEVADPLSAPAVLLPFPRAFHAIFRGALKEFNFPARIEFLAMPPDQFGLIVERIALARGSGHEQLHDAPGFRAVVNAPVEFGFCWLKTLGQQSIGGQQMCQRDSSQPSTKAP